ncbi:uncharacterized protein LOC121875731 [Homarus americanus]|uniref:Uncharacterized protein n=1 Tax=Homarus americanus TaxID=6706 RepID=A0A8J5JNE3_HOMAM|nr:uncharacterized protein LOC121875731 [Homarus americanus]KAG7160936.1 hypothetical protein Hamer_G007719 [Homarus americanus]
MSNTSSLLLLVWLVVTAAAHARVIDKRAISDEGPFMNVVSSVCDIQSPCGWEIYGDLRRHIYYLRGQCECPPSTRCVRVEDNIMVEAYVYKCRRVVSPNFF